MLEVWNQSNNTGPQCPKTFICNESDDKYSFDIGTVPTYISIVSSCFSCIGSLLILFAFWTLKDMRTLAQKIITLLAIADLITASGYLVAAWNFLTYFNNTGVDECTNFETVCKAQSFVTTWSTLCSFGWTVALALHFFLIVRFTKPVTMSRLLILENVTIWIVPLLIVVPLLCTSSLGYTRYATSNWCYVTDRRYPSSNLRSSQETIGLMLVAGNAWEMLSYVAVVVLYALTMKQFRHRARFGESKTSANVEKRLLLIPLVFILLRAWGTIQFFFSIATSDLNEGGCVPYWVFIIYFVLGLFQAAGDGGQGWGNALLYIFMSATIRKELFCAPCERLAPCNKECPKDFTSETAQRVTSAVHITSGANQEESKLLKKNVNNYQSTGYSEKTLSLSMKEPYNESRA